MANEQTDSDTHEQMFDADCAVNTTVRSNGKVGRSSLEPEQKRVKKEMEEESSKGSKSKPSPAIADSQEEKTQEKAITAENLTDKKILSLEKSEKMRVLKKRDDMIIEKSNEHKCAICDGIGTDFSCAAGCGLHTHSLCIGSDAIFTSIVGQVCGNCAILQQNRASHEDVQKGGINGLSVRRAILYISVETCKGFNFEKFGHLASLRLHEIGAIAGYPIKPFAEKFVEPFMQRWVQEKLTNANDWAHNVRDVFTLIIGLFSLRKAFIHHNFTQSVIEIVKERKFSVTDFLGWHPGNESPSVRSSSLCSVCGLRNLSDLTECSRCRRQLVFPSTFARFSSALLATYYAEKVGVPLGTSHLDVFLHVESVRSLYKSLRPVDPDGWEWSMFADQLRMIFGFLDVLSDFGVLQLNPTYFEPEIRYIFNGMYIHQAMLLNEFELVGKFLQSMKLFGSLYAASYNALINACETFLLSQQLSQSGSWYKDHWTVADQYKATVTCAKALLSPKFRGFGPACIECQRYLAKWARAQSKIDSENVNTKQLACGIKIKQHGESNSIRHLNVFYQNIQHNGRSRNFLESTILSRLQMLVNAQAKSTSELHECSSDEPTTNRLYDRSSFSQKEDPASPIDDETPLNDDIADKTEGEDEEDTLTTLSLNGDLEIFNGLKFEDGDVIDITQPQRQSSSGTFHTPAELKKDTAIPDMDMSDGEGAQSEIYKSPDEDYPDMMQPNV